MDAASKIYWSETDRRTFRSLPEGQEVDQIDDACKTLFQVACGGRSKPKGCGSTRFRNKIMIRKDVKEVRNDIQEPVTSSSSSSRCTIAVKV